ncbi:MAG: hypothetical protein ACLR9I_06395 [Eisenbergiella sp.]
MRVTPLKHLGFYRVDYEGSVFLQRSEVGALAGPLPARRGAFLSGIYEADGTMRYAGLRKGFSGPMHRAALQQEAQTADLRSMKVRKELEPLYEETMEETGESGWQRSRNFCERVREQGYLILWDPQYGGKRQEHEDDRYHTEL